MVKSMTERKPTGLGGGGGIMDKLLVPRLINFSMNNSLSDIDSVVSILRNMYKEYQRRPVGPFKQMVCRALKVVESKGAICKPELQLQALEERHLANRSAGTSGRSESSPNDERLEASRLRRGIGKRVRSVADGSEGSRKNKRGLQPTRQDASSTAVVNDGTDSSEEDGRLGHNEVSSDSSGSSEDHSSSKEGGGGSSSSSSEDPELDSEQLPLLSTTLPSPGLNSTLMSMYAKGSNGSYNVKSEGDVVGGESRAGRPAFAPPAEVAAAAARALAASNRVPLNSLLKQPASGLKASTGSRQQQEGCQPLGKMSLELQDTADLIMTSLTEGGSMTGGATATAAAAVTAPCRIAPESQDMALKHVPAIDSNLPAVRGNPGGSTPGGLLGTATDVVMINQAINLESAAGTGTAFSEGQAVLGTLESGKQGTTVKSAIKQKSRRSTGGLMSGAAGLAGTGGGLLGGSTSRGGSAVTTAKAVTYDDLGGIEAVLDDIRELIEYPLKHPEVYAWLGVEPPRGVLLHGPPGCGKTALANAIANECGVPFLRVSAPEIVSGMSGESEAKLRSLFQEALEVAPCIIFIDEIDAIFPKRESAQREMERRIVAQMLTCMDDMSAPLPAATLQLAGNYAPKGSSAERLESLRTGGISNNGNGPAEEGIAQQGAQGPSSDTAVLNPHPHVIVIGATNRPDSLDSALRRAGRFDREISLGIPTEAARVKILQVISRRLRLEGNFDFKYVAKRTPGYVGADLTALCKEAAALAVTRIFRELGIKADEQKAAAAAVTAQLMMDINLTAGNAHGNGNPLKLDTTSNDILMEPADGNVKGGEALYGEDHMTSSTNVQMIADKIKQKLGAQGADDDAAAHHLLVSTAARTGPALLPMIAAGTRSGSTTMAVPIIRSSRFGAGPLTLSELSGLAITMADFEAAIPKVQPSVRREGFTTTPDVTWEDVGSLDEIREELSFSITQPIKHPERFAAMGLAAAAGVLLYGPPGCGKTLVAKAVAADASANFISIKGPELLNKYVGESERAVRQLFTRARAAHPCVLFFDEMDALAPKRGTDTNQAAERVVNQLLTEMDGVEGRQGVFLIAATNRPDMIDPALLRPGRLDKILYVPLPPPDGRVSVLRALTRKVPLDPNTDLTAIGMSDKCEGFSGADMAAVVREACVLSLKESLVNAPLVPWSSSATLDSTSSATLDSTSSATLDSTSSASILPPPLTTPLVSGRHFEAALSRVGPSVSRKDVRMYDAIRHRLRSSRGKLSCNNEAAGVNNDSAPASARPHADSDQTTRPEASGGAVKTILGLGAASLDDDMEAGSKEFDAHQSGSLFEGSVHGLGAGSRGLK